MDTNKVILTGNLTRDVEMKTTVGGKSLASFTIASNRVYKQGSGEQKKETLFTRVAVWGALAGNCSRFLHKGSKVLVVGRLNSREYEKEPGVKAKVYEIVADEVQFLSPKSGGESGGTAYAEDNTPSQEPF